MVNALLGEGRVGVNTKLRGREVVVTWGRYKLTRG